MTLSTSSPDCDVVIVNYNAGALLCDCVESACKEHVDRIVIVDNASEDDSLKTLEDANKNNGLLTIIRNKANLGFAKACNIGASVSSARHILFLNPDSMLCSGALAQMVSTLEGAPRIGMVGGFLSNPDGSEQAGGRRVFPTPKRAFMRAFGLSRLARFFPKVFSDFLLHREALPTAPVAVEAISGACMLVKRDAIEDVGLWDDNYFLHCEDLDWCMRFWQKGWQIMFVPDAKIVHRRGSCSHNRPFFVEWHKHHGMLRFYRKFFRHQYSEALWVLVTIGICVRYLLAASYYGVRYVLATVGLVRD